MSEFGRANCEFAGVSECGQASDLGEIVNECGLQRTEKVAE